MRKKNKKRRRNYATHRERTEEEVAGTNKRPPQIRRRDDAPTFREESPDQVTCPSNVERYPQGPRKPTGRLDNRKQGVSGYRTAGASVTYQSSRKLRGRCSRAPHCLENYSCVSALYLLGDAAERWGETPLPYAGGADGRFFCMGAP